MNVGRAIRAVRTEAGAVLLNTDNGATFSTNVVGATIWECIEQGATKDEIVDRVCSKFDMARDAVSRDVEEFLSSLNIACLL